MVVTYETQVQLGDVHFILDTTGSMQGTLDNVKDNFADVAAEAALLAAEEGVEGAEPSEDSADAADPGKAAADDSSDDG